ncbi:hypothetical protein M4I32_11640 [Microbacterium sp. LRZ72]|uniref:hypothetical protein n=1 Tax=Microbacterium sp. LRZ72 TaxID=2942481 RepID=UPI0029ABDA41|nr:hypothetical protein [Microbacterium sp. LRZ72]MDX2377452.1 hypothetical protein [Microbacterium sp. LRZ72]
MGFALLSASVSCFTQVYPALARRRALALRLTSVATAGTLDRLDALGPDQGAALVRSISASLADSIADLGQNSEIYYFTEKDPRMSMPHAAGTLLTLRDAAERSGHESVRAEGRALRVLIDDLARLLREQYPRTRGESTEAVLRSAAVHHGHDFGDARPPG